MPGPLPLLGLRAFAEVGRTGSVKTAAHTLGVTAGAVSQQVKALEARLDVALFERRNRSLRLTDAGERLLADLSDAFGRIESALEKLAESRGLYRRALVVSTTASFAATWLVPRLGGFVQFHPDIDVRIMTTPELVPIGVGVDSADIAVRHGLGDWPGLHAMPLLQPRFGPSRCGARRPDVPPQRLRVHLRPQLLELLAGDRLAVDVLFEPFDPGRQRVNPEPPGVVRDRRLDKDLPVQLGHVVA